MSFTEFQDRLARSVKVSGLPRNYEKDDILSNLKNAGVIEDIKLGATEMIVTYSTADEKDLSRMYDGCPVGDYVIKLEDPISFEVNSDAEPKSPEKKETKNDFGTGSQSQSGIKVESPQTKPNINVYQSPKVDDYKPVVEEPIKQENNFTQPREERGISQPESQTEKRSEKRTSFSGQVSTEQRSEDSNSKELLRDLQNTNLPARSGLPASDLFKTVTNRNYLLVFTMIWGLQLFLRSLL